MEAAWGWKMQGAQRAGRCRECRGLEDAGSAGGWKIREKLDLVSRCKILQPGASSNLVDCGTER
jgi:hypothetical protein